MNLKSIYFYLKILIVCSFGGVILSHYLEPVQIGTFLKIRNIFYFSTSSSKELVGDIVYSKSKDFDSIYFNPVNFIQSVWPDIYKILNRDVDEIYFENNSKTPIDTNKLILCSQQLMNFVDTVIINNEICYRLVYNIPEVSYSMQPCWYSGMAQGHAIELMVSAFYLTNDSIYLVNAERFASLLNIDVKDGGVKEVVDGGIWFEEYAQYDVIRKSPLVLNGHIFAMDGLYALAVTSKDQKYNIWLRQAIGAVEQNINKYIIAGSWSYYDLFSKPNIADWGYHNIHIQQLKRLIGLNDKMYEQEIPRLTSAYHRFQIGKFVPVGIWARLFFMHNNMLLFAIVINSISLFILSLFVVHFYKKKYD